MALKILKFTSVGQVFENAYAKVDNVVFDNETKIASFDILVYTNDVDKVFIKRLAGKSARIVAGVDMIQQCYNQINNIVTVLKEKIALCVGLIERTVNDDRKAQYESELAIAKKSDYFEFIDAEVWQ